MTELAARFPGYGFERHKGYGTAQHLAALERLGPCTLHRRSFAPVRKAERSHPEMIDREKSTPEEVLG